MRSKVFPKVIFFLCFILILHREYPKVAVGILIAAAILFIIWLVTVFWSDFSKKSKEESTKKRGAELSRGNIPPTRPVTPPTKTATFSATKLKTTQPRIFESTPEAINLPQTQYVPARKVNWPEFQKIVYSNNIKALYHFTDASNLPSIKKNGGLYSWDHCQKNGILINRPGSNDFSRDLDKNKGLEDFVRLTFNRNPPMLVVACRDGRINKPFILEIDPQVMYWEGTQFSDVNAAANNAQIGPDIERLKAIQFSVATKDDLQEDRQHHQAEVLVKNHIPLKYIRNI